MNKRLVQDIVGELVTLHVKARSNDLPMNAPLPPRVFDPITDANEQEGYFFIPSLKSDVLPDSNTR